MDSQDSTVVSVKDLPVQAHCMMQAMAAVELYRAQREVANYFELAYLKLGDMPDFARKVRETANDARKQHIMTNGLMKKFILTAGHIVDTMIPMIIDAIQLEDKEIVVECFTKIMDMANDMKIEAEDTRKRYHDIQDQVQGEMATIVEKNKEGIDEEKKRAIEIKREKDLLKAAKLKEKQIEEEKEKMDKELENLKQYRDEMMEKSVKNVNEQGGDDDEYIYAYMCSILDTLAPGSALGGGIGIVMNVIDTGVNLFKSVFNGKRAKGKSVQEVFKNSQATVEKMLEKNRDMIGRMHDERVNALERLAKIRTLALAEVGICNAESLREASAHLGNVDKQFTRLIQFWNNMAAVLRFLKDDTKAGEVYLKKIENPDYAKRFKDSISRSKKGWSNFGRICQDYITESDSEIGNLYAFLSSPIDSMSADDRKKRLQVVMQGIEDDINNALPDQTSI